MSSFYGFNPPWLGGTQNVMSPQTDERLIKNDILQLIMTVPGDRVMRDDFGVNLRNYVFEPMDPSSVSGLELELRTKLARYEPRVAFTIVKVIPDSQRNGMTVHLFGHLKKDPTKEISFERFIQQSI
jgi:phage baseplate assembly protein W